MATQTHRVLDWRPNPDPRSEPYRLSHQDCWSGGRTRRQVKRTRLVFLDQGSEGACTGFGEETARACNPYRANTSNNLAHAIYLRAKQLDEWPGENYDGSSVNGAQKAARERGFNEGWHWAKTLTEAMHGLSYHGAGEFGTKWWTGMFNPDADGFLHPTGKVEGGHAICISGYIVLPDGSRAWRLDNSWGEDWGDRGGAYLHEFDFMTLLADEGELAFPKKVHNPPVTPQAAHNSWFDRMRDHLKGVHV